RRRLPVGTLPGRRPDPRVRHRVRHPEQRRGGARRLRPVRALPRPHGRQEDQLGQLELLRRPPLGRRFHPGHLRGRRTVDRHLLAQARRGVGPRPHEVAGRLPHPLSPAPDPPARTARPGRARPADGALRIRPQKESGAPPSPSRHSPTSFAGAAPDDSRPVSTTSPCDTVTSTADGDSPSDLTSTSSTISVRIAWSLRTNTRSRSLRLTTPVSRPSAPTTRSRLTPCWAMTRAASTTLQSSWAHSAGDVISPAASTAHALAGRDAGVRSPVSPS